MKWLKTYESWNSESEFIVDVIDLLKSKGLSPIQISDIIDLYTDEIINYYYDGKSPSDFIVSELSEVSSDSKFPLINFQNFSTRTIKYK
jgi:hypothetical protein